MPEPPPPPRAPKPPLRGLRGACACGHPLGAAAAHEAFLAGGSAMDAAVAAAAALSVVMPDACGIGGEALLLVSPPDGATLAYNGTGRSPAGLAGPVPADGGGTVAVPGAVRAWLDAHARHGRLEPERVLAPAIRLAREGAPAGEGTLRAVAAQRCRLERTAAGLPLLAPGLRPGSRVAQPALARTLERIAAEGAAALHEGPLAEAIARAVRADGGALAPEDLAAHETVVAEPVAGEHLGLALELQPPVSQATLVLLALAAVERAAPASELDRLHVTVEALDAAFEHRHELGDPDAPARLRELELQIDPSRAGRRGGARERSHTTAVCAADGDGTVVSMLISVFDDFGSAVLVPEGGFVLNDRLVGFGAPPNDPAPGKRPVHTLSPSIVRGAEGRLAIATPGADAQVQVLAQLLVSLAQGDPLAVALERPRFRMVSGRVVVEGDLPEALATGLRERGHLVDPRQAGDPAFGAVAVAGIDPATGSVLALPDPRRETWAIAT